MLGHDGKIMNKNTILIVEDDKYMAKLVHFILRKNFDGNILIAENGEIALRTCEAVNPDLIFMDIMMPVMDGITSIKKLRSRGFTNPIIALSAYGDIQKSIVYDSGADNVIAKPASFQQILDQLKYMDVPN